MSTVVFLKNCNKNKSTGMLHATFNKLGCNFIYSRVTFGDKIKQSSHVFLHILMTL
jgi:hypothetical protein